jgi:hypothetical protein
MAKTLLLLHLALPGDTPDDVLGSYRAVLLKMQEVAGAPEGTLARIGHFDIFDAFSGGPFGIPGGPLPEPVTFTVVFFGHLVLELAIFDDLKPAAIVEQFPSNDWLIRVCPPEPHPVDWPPPQVMKYGGVHVLRQAWHARYWPPPADTPTPGERVTFFGIPTNPPPGWVPPT